MRKFEVAYTLVKTFPEGTDERIVNLEIEDLSAIAVVLHHPDLTFMQITKVSRPDKKPRKPRKKKEEVING